MLLAFMALQAFAIDSLLQKGAKVEKERVKKATEGKAAAILTLKSVDAKTGEREVVACKWLAREGDNFLYLRAADGALVRTSAEIVAKAEGEVLDKAPLIATPVHHMYCNGKSCEPTKTVLLIPAWPADTASR